MTRKASLQANELTDCRLLQSLDRMGVFGYDWRNELKKRMPQAIQVEVEMPGDLARFRLPKGVQKRLQILLNRQDQGHPLTVAEKREAEGLVDLAEMLSLLRLRSERLHRRPA